MLNKFLIKAAGDSGIDEMRKRRKIYGAKTGIHFGFFCLTLLMLHYSEKILGDGTLQGIIEFFGLGITGCSVIYHLLIYGFLTKVTGYLKEGA
ncbi:hypothetical protein MKR81_26570 (plasmid) [Vibrio campbellii]|uniref:hypothetical protein n=1 Tax=Vibrio campbellii TaxID=680 RepID=UPI001F085F45|nr:hypothetical protein [Vibrio campbellii]UMM06828.1 hypothetical protein MKR81_26570 [Vibrio campbellii]